jgi:prepilin-type N-terminal cleavage/methylation domain-containing protein
LKQENMSMKIHRPRSFSAQAGFSLLELVVAVAILTIVLTAVFNGVNVVVQRSHAEQTKIDLVQEGRDFIDEFERDLHQAGYPNCRMVATAGLLVNCPADFSNPTAAENHLVAAGLVSVDYTQVVFEGAVDGGGKVYSVWYRIVDSAGNYPPSGTCPCRIQRSQQLKNTNDTTPPLSQSTFFSQELENVVNSGVPGVDASGNPLPYGNGLNISGNTAWGQSDTAYYAAISSFKDYPVFQAYDQFGNLVPLPQNIWTTASSAAKLNCGPASTDCIKTIRITVNLLANQLAGVDLKTKIRPVVTLVGDARLVNNY